MDCFTRFSVDRSTDLRRIARHTRGEHTYEDVINEAWLMAATLADRDQVVIDYSDPSFQDMLIAHLYQHLVRYTDLCVRHAKRLDAPVFNDGSSESTYIDSVIGNDDATPLDNLIEHETASLRKSSPNDNHSIASAYLILLERFDYRMRRLSTYLNISIQHTYRRFKAIQIQTSAQHALPLAPAATRDTLRPWRHERYIRIPRQMEFDFNEYLPLRHS